MGRRHARANARIGVNDTGAIGYLGHRKTFDVVGLTTPEEARYWVAGAGSRFEHYEKLYRSSPDRFPTHFIVYPHWMACDAVLGDELHDETVTDQTILGGNHDDRIRGALRPSRYGRCSGQSRAPESSWTSSMSPISNRRPATITESDRGRARDR